MSESFVQMARGFKADPVTIEALPPVPEIEDADKFWEDVHRLRPELYAICAVLAEEIVDEAIQGNAPEQGGKDLETFEDLHIHLQYRLLMARDNGEQRYLTKHDRPEYKRLGELCTFFGHTREGSRYSSARNLIGSGIGTAAKEVTYSLEAIARIVRNNNPQATPEEIIAIARNSTTMINKFAGININHLDGAGMAVSKSGEHIDPEYNIDVQALEIKTKPDGSTYVDFKKPITAIRSPRSSLPDVTIGDRMTKFATLGCPASAKLNGTSAVNKLWIWAIDIAEQAKLIEKANLYHFDR